MVTDRPNQTRFRRGLARMELVVLIAIGLIVLVTLPPWLLKLRDESRKQHGTNRMRKIGLAVGTYHEIYQAFPPVKNPRETQDQK